MRFVLVIDNDDSFVYSLVRYIQELDVKTVVKRRNELTLESIKQITFSHIVISPGPCTPQEAGIANDIIKTYQQNVPILGVCLGHQCIAHVHHSTVKRALKPMHGKIDTICHDGKGVFKKLPQSFNVTRYHSLVVDDLCSDLEVCATSDLTKEIMAIKHKNYPLFGVQFHPEALLSEHGHALLSNFLSYS